MNLDNDPLVSVLIAAYNEEKYILECIDSIINQTYNNIEIIVIDDGSTDKTLDILESYNDNRLKIFTHENRGRVFSRNRALSLASGKYVILQDADDWSDKRRIESQVNTAEELNGNPVVGCNYVIVKNNTQMIKCYPEEDIDIRKRMSRLFFSQAFLPASILLLRSHLIALKGWREKFDVACEDGDLLDRIYEDDSSVFYNIQHALYYYRINEGSVTNKVDLTIPYQVFKRDCKLRRRSQMNEFDDIQDYLMFVSKNILRRLLYKLSYFSFIIAKRIKNTN